jgi:2-methylisocitrate lyase-like PEP mutase family enzyme
METDLLARQAQALRDLHRPGEPLLLPNAWDAASARAVADAGFPVVATTSLAVAASLGFPDTDSMPVDQAFAAISRIAGTVDLPVTADIEAGYQLPAADLVERLLGAGAVGCNLEDTDHHGPHMLVPIEQQADRLRSVREASVAAGVPIVINARVDLFLHDSRDPQLLLPEAIRRARAYLEAGADCVYPIFLTDPAAIEAFVQAVGAPVNILLRPDGPSPAALGRLGVARISMGAGLFRAAMAEVDRVLESLQTRA